MTPDMMNAQGPARKARIAILGEFSSGKSTLTNVLLGHVSSPVRVTATQVPPIWYCHGRGDPVVVSNGGAESPVDGVEISAVPIEGTEYVRVALPADILERVDLIDMPGSSDPNMSADIWQGVLPQADAVIWCTPATQAWRQSEAAIWDEVEDEVRARSLLLVTRIDKVLSERDRDRLMKRVRRETQGMFRDVLAADLLAAQEGREGSGMTAVRAALDAILGASADISGAAQAEAATLSRGEPATVLRLEDHAPAASRPTSTVMPRRVSAGGIATTRRPRRTSSSGGSAL
jgi:GTPase SAR1 family protein